MYKKNNGSTEQEILQNQFSAYVKKAVHNRRIQFLTEKSRKFRFETPLFDLDYLLFDTTDIIQEITDHETVRQALRSIKENERRIVLERIIEEKSFGQLSDELGMSYKTVRKRRCDLAPVHHKPRSFRQLHQQLFLISAGRLYVEQRLLPEIGAGI